MSNDNNKVTAANPDATLPGEFGEMPGKINPHLDEDNNENGDKECSNCNGEGEIDLTVRAPRIVECEKCNGEGISL